MRHFVGILSFFIFVLKFGPGHLVYVIAPRATTIHQSWVLGLGFMDLVTKFHV